MISLKYKVQSQGLAEAQKNLGLMYAEGAGITQDDQEAYFWLSLAAVQTGDATPVKNLVEKKLTPEERDRVKKRLQDWTPKENPA